jgi:hypothetical protein
MGSTSSNLSDTFPFNNKKPFVCIRDERLNFRGSTLVELISRIAPLVNDNGFSPDMPTKCSAYLLPGAFQRLLSEKGLTAGDPFLSGSDGRLLLPLIALLIGLVALYAPHPEMST